MFGLGPLEFLLIVVIVLVLFGGKRIGGLLGSIGGGIREFRRNISDQDIESRDARREEHDRRLGH